MSRMNLAKLQIVRNNQNRNGSGGEGSRQMRYGGNDGQQSMTYMPPYGSPGMYGDDGMDMRRRYRTHGEYDGDREMRRGYQTRGAYDDNMDMRRRMGFDEHEGYGTEMRRRRRKDGTFMHHGGMEEENEEPIRFGGVVSMGGTRSGDHHKMTREMAEEWVESMEGSDPAKPHGAKWSMDQVKPIATKYGIPTEGEKFFEFWAVMNAMYSDYYPVAKKYNTLTPDFFADLAMAFISDKDAVKNKAAVYYECIVDK